MEGEVRGEKFPVVSDCSPKQAQQVSNSSSIIISSSNNSRAMADIRVVNWCETHFNVVKFSYKWIIKDFSFYAEEVGESIKSSSFSAGFNHPLKWHLVLYPHGEAKQCSEYLSLFLFLDWKVPVLAKFKFSIINAYGVELNQMDSKRPRRFKRGYICGYPKFIRRTVLFDEDNDLLPDDKLTIFCMVTMLTDKVEVSGRSTAIGPKSRLSQDLGALFEGQISGDVIFRVKRRQLLAHKVILAARSPVFAAMFTHEMKERIQNTVHISDINYDVLTEMMQFIYTGKAPNIEKMADDLLFAADKYALDRLKVMCEKALAANLSVANAAYTLVLADMHSADQLKAQSMHFIRTHAADVMETKGWKSLNSRPHLLKEASAALWVQ